MLDIVNGAYVRRSFNPRSWCDLGDRYRLEYSELTRTGVNCAWINVDKSTGKSLERRFFVRLYDKKTISDTLKSSGLRPEKFFGDFAGGRLSGDSQRIIVVARKT